MCNNVRGRSLNFMIKCYIRGKGELGVKSVPYFFIEIMYCRLHISVSFFHTYVKKYPGCQKLFFFVIQFCVIFFCNLISCANCFILQFGILSQGLFILYISLFSTRPSASGNNEMSRVNNPWYRMRNCRIKPYYHINQ